MSRQRFRAPWFAAMAVAMGIAILLALGFWQLDRGREKAALQAAFAERQELPAMALRHFDPEQPLDDPQLRYQRVIATGSYDPRHVLLDNQLREGRPGYHVYTPLRLGEGGILVNRGWLAARPDRRLPPGEALTPVENPEGMEERTIRGRLAQPANPGLRLGNPGEGPWPQVVQHLDYPQLSRALGYPLAPAIILLDADAPGRFPRDWRPTFGGFGPERHRGYAVQWFGLAAALGVVFIAAHWRRPAPAA
ncbi:MAG: SURF1 family protein [Candidatus Competibacterales bacterium]